MIARAPMPAPTSAPAPQNATAPVNAAPVRRDERDIAPADGGTALLRDLPEALRARLHTIGQGHRTMFGNRRPLQASFDEHIDLFEHLIARGASHAIVSRLLAAVGIAGSRGAPLPIGTVSGALSRARERAAAARAATPAKSATVPSASRIALQEPTGSRGDAQDPAAPSKTAERTATARRAMQEHDGPPAAAPKPVPADDWGERVLNSANRLNQLRST